MNKIAKIMVLATSVLLTTACGGGNETSNNTKPNEDTQTPTPGQGTDTDDNKGPEETTKKNFENIVFNDKTVTYDGTTKTITATGVIEGATVTYTNAGPHKDAGTYQIGIKVTKDGYNDFEKTATLTINKATFTGLSLATKNVTYDTKDHVDDIKVTGTLPESTVTTVTYSTKLGTKAVTEAKDVGAYTVTAVVSNKNYNDLTLTATLNITKADFDETLYTYDDVSVPYDGADHFNDVTFSGILPDTAKTSQKVTKDGVVVSEAIDSGTYNYQYTVQDKNYNTIVFEATLKITTKEVDLGVVKLGDQIFFANQIDDKKLYSYDTLTGEVNAVSRDISEHFEPLNTPDEKHVFISKGGLLSSVKTINNEGSIETLYSGKASEIVAGEKANEYIISVNNLTATDSGIYKLTFNTAKDSILTPIISNKKISHLTRVDDGLYFIADKNLNYYDFASNHSYVIKDEEEAIKVTEMTSSGNTLVFNRNKLLGDFIQSVTFNRSQGTFTLKKLTSDAGKYLNIVGNDVYYSNIDALTSNVFGLGISKTSLLAASTLPGTKVVDAATKISNLYISDGVAYYYHVENSSLYEINLTSGDTKNILEGFVKPEPVTLVKDSGKNLIYKGNVYYTNVYDDKSLYKYNPETEVTVKLTSNHIEDFIIVDDILYYNQVTFGINNDLYSLELKPNAAPVKLSTNDCVNLFKHGNYLYYTKENGAGLSTGFERIDLTKDIETNTTIISKKTFEHYVLDGTTLYGSGKANLNNYLNSIDISDETVVKAPVEVSQEVKNADQIELFNNKLVVLQSNQLYTFDHKTPKAKLELIPVGNKVTEFVITNNKIYFSTKDAEIKVAALDGSGIKTLYKSANGMIVPRELSVLGNEIFFNSDKPNSYHFYKIDLTDETGTQTATQLD